MRIIKSNRIVILGADGTGKTTLAKELASVLKFIYYKDSNYKRYFFGNSSYPIHSASAVLQLTKVMEEGIIFDRFFMDEYVYGKVFNREFDKKLFAMLITETIKQDFKYIYCYSMKPRPDELIDSKYLPEVEKAYTELFKEYIPESDWIHVNPTLDYLSTTLNRLNKIL